MHKLSGACARASDMANIVSRRCTFVKVNGTVCCSIAVGATSLCTVHQPGYVQARSGYSKVCCEFMDAYMDKHNVHVQHKHYDKLTGILVDQEHRVTGMSSLSGSTKVDGWIEDTRTVLEFHGDYYHGNPEKYNLEDLNPTTNCRFGLLYDRTMDRMSDLHRLGFTVVYVWENTYKQWKTQAGLFTDLLP